MQSNNRNKKVIIIGAGPVGIAAAAHLLERSMQPLVLEKGERVGAAIREWGHVRLFTPWKYLIDQSVERLLAKTDWSKPDAETMPTGREIVEHYLVPAATLTPLSDVLVYGAKVTAVTKNDKSKSSSGGRDEADYTVRYQTSDGQEYNLRAEAVIDASGTWYSPNPMGLDGLKVPGEEANTALIHYGIPDVMGEQKTDYAGKRTLVLGGGHSAINVVLDLLKLQQQSGNTSLYWGLRSSNIEKLLGGGINDELPARGELGLAAKRAIDSGALTLLTPLKVQAVTREGNGLSVAIEVDNRNTHITVDRIVVAAGFKPDLTLLSELRLNIDDIVEAPSTLAPLIDPNHHSCGTVKPHGVVELTHHDKNFFIVGMKSYGRAPTFLMFTGYEQVRSIAAELAGDHEAARRVELVLPETGVCNSNTGTSGGGCCAPAKADKNSVACCETEVKGTPEENPLTAAASCCPSTDTVKPAASGCCAPAPEKPPARAGGCCG